jgi:hypothetical protein
MPQRLIRFSLALCKQIIHLVTCTRKGEKLQLSSHRTPKYMLSMMLCLELADGKNRKNASANEISVVEHTSPCHAWSARSARNHKI